MLDIFPDYTVNSENIKILGYFWEYAWFITMEVTWDVNKKFQTLSRIVQNSKGYKK